VIGRAIRAFSRLDPAMKVLAGGYGGAAGLGVGFGITNLLDKRREEEKADTFNEYPGAGPRTSTDPDEARADYKKFEPPAVLYDGSDPPTETNVFDWKEGIKHDLGKTDYGSSYYVQGRETALQRAAEREYKAMEGKPGNQHLPKVNWDKRNDQIRHSNYSAPRPGKAGHYVKEHPPSGTMGGPKGSPYPLATNPPDIEYFGDSFNNQEGVVVHELGHHMAQKNRDPRSGAKNSDDWSSEEMKAAVEAAGLNQEGSLGAEHTFSAGERWSDFAYQKRLLAHAEYPSYGQAVKDQQDLQGYDAINTWYKDPANKAGKDKLDDYILTEKSMHEPDWQPSDYFNEQVMDNWLNSHTRDAQRIRQTIINTHPEGFDPPMPPEKPYVKGSDLKRLFPKDYEQLMKIIKISQHNKPVGLFTGRSAMPA
jgi:hypothetical protein